MHTYTLDHSPPSEIDLMSVLTNSDELWAMTSLMSPVLIKSAK